MDEIKLGGGSVAAKVNPQVGTVGQDEIASDVDSPGGGAGGDDAGVGDVGIDGTGASEPGMAEDVQAGRKRIAAAQQVELGRVAAVADDERQHAGHGGRPALHQALIENEP